MAKLNFALQLYSVRDHLEPDPAGTLKRVKEAGYDYVETAGTAGLPAAEFKRLADDAGVTVVSAHIGYDEVAADLPAVLEAVRLFGLRYAVVPWIGPEMCPDKDAWLTAARKLDEVGAAMREQGVRLCYHNHDHEFRTQYDGQEVFDLLYAHTAPEHLAAQLDAGWARVAGKAPQDIIRRFGNRMPLLHIKDFKSAEPPEVTEIGQGIVDWDPVFAAGCEAGVDWYIVEQDESDTDSLESAAENARYMASRAG